jgi:hypothetical protein
MAAAASWDLRVAEVDRLVYIVFEDQSSYEVHDEIPAQRVQMPQPRQCTPSRNHTTFPLFPHLLLTLRHLHLFRLVALVSSSRDLPGLLRMRGLCGAER